MHQNAKNVQNVQFWCKPSCVVASPPAGKAARARPQHELLDAIDDARTRLRADISLSSHRAAAGAHGAPTGALLSRCLGDGRRHRALRRCKVRRCASGPRGILDAHCTDYCTRRTAQASMPRRPPCLHLTRHRRVWAWPGRGAGRLRCRHSHVDRGGRWYCTMQGSGAGTARIQ